MPGVLPPKMRKVDNNMEEERDVVVFSDDDGNEFELEVIDYFDYEDQEYAVLVDPNTAENEAEKEDEADTEVYIMKIVVNGEYEEFLPADEDKMEVLSAIVEQRFEQWDEECDCDCEHEECDCGCEHEENDAHDCGCGCGCHDHE